MQPAHSTHRCRVCARLRLPIACSQITTIFLAGKGENYILFFFLTGPKGVGHKTFFYISFRTSHDLCLRASSLDLISPKLKPNLNRLFVFFNSVHLRLYLWMSKSASNRTAHRPSYVNIIKESRRFPTFCCPLNLTNVAALVGSNRSFYRQQTIWPRTIVPVDFTHVTSFERLNQA